jgi:hypothetical protein
LPLEHARILGGQPPFLVLERLRQQLLGPGEIAKPAVNGAERVRQVGLDVGIAIEYLRGQHPALE